MFELHLLLDLLVAVLAVPFSERMFRTRTMEFGAAGCTPNCWRSQRFVAHGTIGHVITRQTYIKLTDKDKEIKSGASPVAPHLSLGERGFEVSHESREEGDQARNEAQNWWQFIGEGGRESSQLFNVFEEQNYSGYSRNAQYWEEVA